MNGSDVFGKMKEGEERRCVRRSVCADNWYCGMEVCSVFSGRTVWVCGKPRPLAVADSIRFTSRMTVVDTCSITFPLSLIELGYTRSAAL